MKNYQGENWQRLLQELLAEPDKTKLAAKAMALEEALFHRSQELPVGDGATPERAAIKDASRALLEIRAEKLGFPIDPKILGGSRRTGEI